MSYKNIVIFILTACFLTAADTISSNFSFSPWGFFTFGRVESSINDESTLADPDFTNFWISDFDAGFKATLEVGEYGKIRFNFGYTTGFPIINERMSAPIEAVKKNFKTYLLDAAMEHTFSINNKHTISTEFGFFPFKYNPQVRNLGEYLFRSTIYPTVIYNNFDIADEKLVGLHGKYKYAFNDLSNIQADLLFTSEQNIYPLHDFSLSYIFTGNFFNFINLGAGIMHSHLIPIDKKHIIPANRTEISLPGAPNYNYYTFEDSSDNLTKYTFKGTKAMGRITLDPKAFFDLRFFGSEDLKLYGEINVLGIKNFKGWYENRNNRLVYNLGFNLPGFKILDVLAVEGEYWDNPYPNALQNVWKQGSPVPYPGDDRTTPNYYRFHDDLDTTYSFKPLAGDEWRWSIYASKTIFNRLSLICQFASDHTMRDKYFYNLKSYTEMIPRTKDWYWIAKIKYSY